MYSLKLVPTHAPHTLHELREAASTTHLFQQMRWNLKSVRAKNMMGLPYSAAVPSDSQVHHGRDGISPFYRQLSRTACVAEGAH